MFRIRPFNINHSMGTWNDTDIPLAHLITFRTYGTWLHGDPRGSTSRHRNIYRTPFLPPEENWIETNTARMLREPVKLDAHRRRCVNDAIREVCEKRAWGLHAANVRTNHGHAVISIGLASSGVALNALKANATRIMREAGVWTSDKTPWADKGSQRRLWNEQSVANAINYVVNYQGDDLPDFF